MSTNTVQNVQHTATTVHDDSISLSDIRTQYAIHTVCTGQLGVQQATSHDLNDYVIRQNDRPNIWEKNQYQTQPQNEYTATSIVKPM